MSAFWSDGFDMDLLKVLPETPQIMGELAGRTLYTVTSAHRAGDRLNHPCVWHHQLGMVAFFGTSPGGFVPQGYHPCPEDLGRDDRVVECTALEAFRDAWPHQYAMALDGRVIWNTQGLWPLFQQLMWSRRGWGRVTQEDEGNAIAALTDSVVMATERLRGVLGA